MTDCEYRERLQVVFNNPQGDWLHILGDIDFSGIEGRMYSELSLKNPHVNSGYGLRFHRFGQPTFQVEILRDETTERVVGTNFDVFDASRLQFPPQIPVFLNFRMSSVEALKKGLEFYFPQAVMAGYNLQRDSCLVVEDARESQGLLKVTSKTTGIHLCSLETRDRGRQIWLPQDNFDKLVNKYSVAKVA